MKWPEPPEPVARAWPGLRAALIAVLLVAQCADALPLPTLSKRDLRHPVAKAELIRWAKKLNAWGYPITRRELADKGLAVGDATRKLQRILLTPTRPFRRITGTGQSWGLFAFPEPHAGRLVVRGRPENGEWVELFTAPDSPDPQLGDVLRYRRVRGIYDDAADRPRPGRLWIRFSRFVAREVFAEHPDFDEVEVRIDLLHIVPPGSGEPDETREYHARLELRSEIEAHDTRSTGI